MRACGHEDLRPAGECELCDVDWLIEQGEGEAVENDENRKEIVRALGGENVSRHRWDPVQKLAGEVADLDLVFEDLAACRHCGTHRRQRRQGAPSPRYSIDSALSRWSTKRPTCPPGRP